MSATPLLEVASGLSKEHRSNLATVLQMDRGASVEDICEALRWLYRSKARARFSEAAASGWWLLASVAGRRSGTRRSTGERCPVPTWEELIEGVGRYLKVYDAQAATHRNELYISHAIVVRALAKMSPEQRTVFFARGGAGYEIGDGGGLLDRIRGPARAAAALGAAMPLVLACTRRRLRRLVSLRMRWA